jgi:hypothetical protein
LIKAGDRFYSEYFHQCGKVTRYIDDDNWWFVLDISLIDKLLHIKPIETKARSKPSKLYWLRKDSNEQ